MRTLREKTYIAVIAILSVSILFYAGYELARQGISIISSTL